MPQLSLKGRALRWLAQREQSRAELRRKLLPHAVAQAQVQGQAQLRAEADPEADPPSSDESTPAARVESLLDWLEAHQHLSQERFVESRVHARAPRFGNLRIRQELKQHQVALTPDVAQALRDSELQRAATVRARKFAEPPSNSAERARQSRFLAGRGFSPEVIGRVLRSLGRPDGVDDEAKTGAN